MNKLVETPLEEHSRSLFTALVHKHYSLAQLNLIFAKLSSFILNKHYNYFPLANNISDEIFQPLPKHVLRLLFLKFLLFLLLPSFTRLILLIYSKLQIPMCV